MPQVLNQDAELYYEISGTSGEPVLLIQGVGVSGKGWTPQVEALSKHYRVITFDLRGSGKSTAGKRRLTVELMADDVQVVMQAIGWKSCHIIGHSLGGIIAQRVALTAPQKVRSLILLCTAARGRHASALNKRLVSLSLRYYFGSKAGRRKTVLELLYPASYLDKADLTELSDQLSQWIGRDLAQPPASLFKQIQALRRHDCTDELSKLRSVPTLVISASQDLIAPPRRGRELAMRLPGAQFLEIPDSGHGLPFQLPRLVSDLIGEFLDRPAPSSDRRRSRDRL